MYDPNMTHVYIEDAGDRLIDISIANGELENLESEEEYSYGPDDIIEAPSDFGSEDYSNPEDSIELTDARDIIVQQAMQRRALLNDDTVEVTLDLEEEPIDGLTSEEIDQAEDLDDLLEMAWSRKSENRSFYRE